MIKKVVLTSVLTVSVLSGCGDGNSKKIEELEKQVADLEKQIDEKDQDVSADATNESDGTSDTAEEGDLSDLLGIWMYENGNTLDGRYLEISEQDKSTISGTIKVNWENQQSTFIGEYQIISSEKNKWNVVDLRVDSGDPEGKQTIEIIDGKLVGFPVVVDAMSNSAIKLDTSLDNLSKFERVNGEWYLETDEERSKKQSYNIEDEMVYLTYYEGEKVIGELDFEILGTTENGYLIGNLEKVFTPNGDELTEEEVDKLYNNVQRMLILSIDDNNNLIVSFAGEKIKLVK